MVPGYGSQSFNAHPSVLIKVKVDARSTQMPWDGFFSINGGRVTSSSFTARIESMPRSYEPETPLFPPSNDMPTVRIRSRIISI